jgi:hypothetical protein
MHRLIDHSQPAAPYSRSRARWPIGHADSKNANGQAALVRYARSGRARWPR